MKILSNKRYKELVDNYSLPYSAITYKQHCKNLEEELEKAKDLKSILEKMSSLTVNGSNIWADGATISTGFRLPDNVLVYVDDILGGKVIKQEGNKCLVVSKDGTVKTGLTKSKTDKGYSYKLVRE